MFSVQDPKKIPILSPGFSIENCQTLIRCGLPLLGLNQSDPNQKLLYFYIVRMLLQMY